jgi:YVTN family beta-propeller protein
MLPGNIRGLTLESIGNQGNFHSFYSLKLSDIQALAININTNKIYVADSGSKNLIVIDGNSGNITPIAVGGEPYAIAIDPDTNKIYVADSASTTDPHMSDKVTLIDGDTNKNETDIPVGNVRTIAVNPNGDTIYVAPTAGDNVMVYRQEGAGSGYKQEVVIPTGGHPTSIAVNTNTNKIYVVNSNKDSVSVIDDSTDTMVADIHVGQNPSSIAVNTNTNKIYVVNSNSDTVSVINGNTYTNEAHDIPVGKTPETIAVNPVTNKIYVANKDNDIVSVINGSTDTRVTDIPLVDPEAIAANPADNTIYVANYERGGSVTVIDGNTNKVAAGVTFNIDPAHSGQIICKNVVAPTNEYFYIGLGTQCTALPNKGFEFNSWVENLPHNSTIPLSQSAISDSPWNSFLSSIGMKPNDASASFDVNRFGTFTANFKAVPPPVPPEYWFPLYGIIVSTIVGWSIPSIIGWIKSKTQLRRASQYHKRIHSLCTDNNKLYENDKSLDTLKTDIKNAYAEGKISEQHYNNLKGEASIVYTRAYKNKIDSLYGKVEGENNRIELDKIKNDITDAYTEGKITEQHYNLLKEEIANFSHTRHRSST